MMEFLQFMEPWMIPIVIMAFVTLMILITTVGSIVKEVMIKKESKDLTQNEEFLDALKEFKETMDLRMGRLERKMASLENETNRNAKEIEATDSNKSIKIELNEQKAKEERSADSAKLRNMLS